MKVVGGAVKVRGKRRASEALAVGGVTTARVSAACVVFLRPKILRQRIEIGCNGVLSSPFQFVVKNEDPVGVARPAHMLR